ncbi:MAG: TetR/AcrR family transcriptional regulator [Desulfobacterales bacterium]|nr:TetR/AcrR family transcriptional regulator [Desulfobacterales bacterium]
MGRKSKADERRTQIMEAFYHCVAEQGIANASVRKIANQAGVQPSTLHHYFKSKDEIIEEAVVYFTDHIFEGFRGQMADAGGENLDQGIAFIFSKGMINEDHTGFFLECLVAARHNARIRETIAGLFRRFRRAIVSHLEQVPGFDRLGDSRKALLASTIVAIHEGIELQWFADPGAVDLARTLETTRDLIGFFMENTS